ncbi:GAF domain-containing sensor histidine kinase [Nocardioides sp. TRM66260-LWL]|uniref:sensor histidine kinase n=1 Tax=Nocardioides sp. TRM66260-LWL TaxID=2874478 RepID=UPI001CC50067|nr:GAF domain-containing sensor histidine kinase [Nocardioides sp. TRM66260-LWL]MBZ5734340.1 GAF domain-containing sensor histidine kinase [Nocardioides sp. TRM66260-LWL]
MTLSPDVDRRRAVVIDRYRVVVDPPRADLRALVEVAAHVADVPMATINLITETHQHQVAAVGFEASVCAREDSMCNLAIGESLPVIVTDASLDERFAANPFVTGEIGRVRFYASHQLRTPEGVVIGTLCVFDVRPRELSRDQVEDLARLAERVVDLLELELRTRELTRTVDELERTRTELERSNAQLAAFAGQVSHDLRNPMTGLDLSLSMMAEEVEASDAPPGDLPYLLDRARGSLTRMQGLVDDLLSFARVGGRLASGPVDLREVVDEVRHDLAPLLSDAEVVVEELPVVTGDPVLLRAAVQNLVANAASYVAPGERPRVRVRADRRDDRWRIEVVDHGLGVPEDQRERVFEPLVRVHKQIPGTGIGLATVRRIADAHGGRVGLDETPGGGTTAWLELPASPG